MSLQNKLKQAAAAAASEAAIKERGRCLWCLDEIIEELRTSLEKKLLVERERHIAQTKLRIAEALAGQIRRMIVSNIQPTTNEEKEAPDNER